VQLLSQGVIEKYIFRILLNNLPRRGALKQQYFGFSVIIFLVFQKLCVKINQAKKQFYKKYFKGTQQ